MKGPATSSMRERMPMLLHLLLPDGFQPCRYSFTPLQLQQSDVAPLGLETEVRRWAGPFRLSEHKHMFALTCGRVPLKAIAQVRDVAIWPPKYGGGWRGGRGSAVTHSEDGGRGKSRRRRGEGRGGSGPSGRVISGPRSKGGHRCW